MDLGKILTKTKILIIVLKMNSSRLKTYEDDFQLDEKFEILAKEIKKRMNKRGN